MLDNKENQSHSIAAKYILSNTTNTKNLEIFENSYVNKLYIELLEESKNLYLMLENNCNISSITKSLDKKRSLTKQFKSVTGLNWRL